MDGEKEKLKKQRYDNLYMDLATRIADMSHARRLHVGAVIIKDSNIISFGWNGMPAGWDNDCEDKVWDKGAGGWLDPEEFNETYPYEGWHEGAHQMVRYGLKTKPEVLHAEQNALTKLARSTESGLGATMFITHAPCLDCAKLVYQSGINSVYYRNSYRDTSGLEFLEKAGVKVEKI